MTQSLRSVPSLQGSYYLITGLWPWIHLRSFEWLSGPKTDDWLVRTVGLLVAVVGAVLLLATWRRRITAEIAFLALGSAGALAFVDVYYVAVGRIWPIYLGDAVLQVLLILGWLRR